MTDEEWRATVVQSLRAVGSSMRVLCHYRDLRACPDILRPFYEDIVVDLATERHMVVVYPPGVGTEDPDLGQKMEGLGWVFKSVEADTNPDAASHIVVDQFSGLGFRAKSQNDISVALIPGGTFGAEAVCGQFDKLFTDSPLIKYAYAPKSAFVVPDQRIAVVSEERWEVFLRYLKEHPDELYRMAPGDFEELVCELMRRDGMDAHLTPPTRDGGRDVIASVVTSVGKHLYLAECKRYAPNRLVGVRVVRELYGVVCADQATSGIVVTTSAFTGPAIEFQRTVEYRMGLKDYEDVISWVKKVSQ